VSDHLFEVEPGDSGTELDRGGFVASAKRWWWLLALAAIASGVMAYLVADRIPTSYTAETRLLVGPFDASDDTLRAASANTETFAAIAESDPVLEAAAERAGVGLSLETLRREVSTDGNQTTRFLSISVTDEHPEIATGLARAVAMELEKFVQEHPGTDPSQGGTGGPQGGTGGQNGPSAQPGALRAASSLTVVQPAATPTPSSGASTTLIVAGAAVGGMLVALLIAVIADSFTTSIRDEEEVARLTGASVLGSVDGWRGGRRGGLAVTAEPDSKAAVAYRVLAMKIEGLSAPLRTLLVVATEPSEGGSDLAANLAAVLAARDTPITLLELGNRNELQAAFSPNGARPNRPALRRAKLLRHEGAVLERFRVTGQSVTVAFPRANLDSLDREGAQGLFDSLLEDTDTVVVNAPPPDVSATTLALASAADATVLVARARRTNRKKVGTAADSLRMVGANLLGTVVRDSRAV
jgi:capsular polysaccharide biosynthesis protein